MVSDGVDMSCVGHVAESFRKHYNLLDGRVAQVVHLLENSDDPALRRFSDNHNGVFEVALIDRAAEGDEGLEKVVTY